MVDCIPGVAPVLAVGAVRAATTILIVPAVHILDDLLHAVRLLLLLLCVLFARSVLQLLIGRHARVQLTGAAVTLGEQVGHTPLARPGTALFCTLFITEVLVVIMLVPPSQILELLLQASLATRTCAQILRSHVLWITAQLVQPAGVVLGVPLRGLTFEECDHALPPAFGISWDQGRWSLWQPSAHQDGGEHGAQTVRDAFFGRSRARASIADNCINSRSPPHACPYFDPTRAGLVSHPC